MKLQLQSYCQGCADDLRTYKHVRKWIDYIVHQNVYSMLLRYMLYAEVIKAEKFFRVCLGSMVCPSLWGHVLLSK